MARKPIQTAPGQAADQGKPDEVDAPVGPIVLIRALRGPRRRAGMRFAEVPIEVDAGQLTEAQKRALIDDPLLHVTPKAGDPDTEGD